MFSSRESGGALVRRPVLHALSFVREEHRSASYYFLRKHCTWIALIAVGPPRLGGNQPTLLLEKYDDLRRPRKRAIKGVR